MTIAAGVLLLLAAAALRTRWGRLTLAIWVLRAGAALADVGARIVERQRR